MKPVFHKWLVPGLLSAATLAGDFCAKSWANANLHYGDSSIFIPGLLRLTLTRNTGGAFGIGRGHGIMMALLASSIVLGIIIWMWKREKSSAPPTQLERCGVGLIIGGALGNLFDRITRGEVTDFLEFSFIDFPVFNVADALIDVGAGLVIIGALAFSKAQNNAAQAENKASD
ncbi:MAG: signal peptidase II [Candidatus Obscuribacterales bacterium]|nr:signal peptidase II [Candidatus Obscuribacterales bacterium]